MNWMKKGTNLYTVNNDQQKNKEKIQINQIFLKKRIIIFRKNVNISYNLNLIIIKYIY